MKIKTQNLTGLKLDWAVVKCEYGLKNAEKFLDDVIAHPNYSRYRPSLNWVQGGPIIERERFDVTYCPNRSNGDQRWLCEHNDVQACKATGPTPLVAAMRCLVLSRLGEEVEIPENLS